MNSNNVYAGEQSRAITNIFLRKVYLWMTAGLAVTACAAFFMLSSVAAQQFVFGNHFVFYGLIIAELGLVMVLSATINRINASTATLLFMGYSVLNGITFAAIFLVYTGNSIASVFLITSGTFAAMSIYGYATQRDLSGFGSFLFMGLIGVVIASVVNIFLHSEMIYWITSYVGVFVFVGLTAYDTQKIKKIGQAEFANGENQQKAAIIGIEIVSGLYQSISDVITHYGQPALIPPLKPYSY